MIYEPDCIVYNKGPLTIRDFLNSVVASMQDTSSADQQNYAAATMKISPIVRQLLSCRDFALGSPRKVLWTLGTIILEGVARLQGSYDYHHKHQHHIWQMVNSTKNLQVGINKALVPSNDMSVIIFRFHASKCQNVDLHSESEERRDH